MSVKTRLQLGAAALVTVAVAVVAVLLVAAVAHGQPASAPASQVVVPLPAPKGWLGANLAWLVPLAIFVVSTLATFLSRYPRAKGVVAALRMFGGGLSMLEFKDGKRPGLVLKWPAALPAPPPDDTKGGAV